MAKFEVLPTIDILPNETILPTQQLPELVHLNDPAFFVMIDFTKTAPQVIKPNKTMDEAIREMKVTDTNLLLVMNEAGHFLGVISSEDVLGEKPIQIIQERRIARDQVLVSMLMIPYSEITAIDISIVKGARVGNVVKTLSEKNQHCALAVLSVENQRDKIIRGIFTATQISKQLHHDFSY